MYILFVSECSMDYFKGDFLSVLIFLHPQIPDFQILSFPSKSYINGKLIHSALR